MKFRKKPIIIEAWQYLGQNIADMPKWVTLSSVLENNMLVISTLEGNMIASYGDWIIKGVKGEIYPCKPDIFAQTYEPI